MFNLTKSPYLLTDTATQQVCDRLGQIEERVSLLRRSGTLTESTLKDYYGEKRFEQVAESNALEGATLSVGETELAVLKGVTITGHDPAFTRDAVALDHALSQIVVLAKETATPTNLEQVYDIHRLLLGDHPSAGTLRDVRVAIRGSSHTPPKTRKDVLYQMTELQTWSLDNASLPAPIRSAVLHAWLTHIHPFVDGNGRTARAIGNLELIRAGYPPIIIKKKERDRYLEALGESDEGGDIRAFIELIFDRIEGGLTGLEQSATKRQGFNPALERIRLQQEKQLIIWQTSVKLLASIIEHRLSKILEPVNGTCNVFHFEAPLDIEDYAQVCMGRNVPRSWAFIVRILIPGFSRFEKLAYIGHRSTRVFQHLGREGGPSLFWSRLNPDGFPKWMADGPCSPYATEITSHVGNGDEWFARLKDDSIERVQTTELAQRISDFLLNQAQGSSGSEAVI